MEPPISEILLIGNVSLAIVAWFGNQKTQATVISHFQRKKKDPRVGIRGPSNVSYIWENKRMGRGIGPKHLLLCPLDFQLESKPAPLSKALLLAVTALLRIHRTIVASNSPLQQTARLEI